MLREPIFLPPMTLTLEELRALHLGAELVRQTSDGQLATAAERLLTKVSAVLPSGMRSSEPLQGLAVYASLGAAPGEHLALLRRAVAERRVLAVRYRRLDGTHTVRRIHPFQTEAWGRIWTCPAWCELRGGFRVFRVDRIEICQDTGDGFTPAPGRSYGDHLATLEAGRSAG